MQRGSIWGHGSYLAPDWSADWLHREALALLDIKAQQEYQLGNDQLELQQQEMLAVALKHELKENTYDDATAFLLCTKDHSTFLGFSASNTFFRSFNSVIDTVSN